MALMAIYFIGLYFIPVLAFIIVPNSYAGLATAFLLMSLPFLHLLSNLEFMQHLLGDPRVIALICIGYLPALALKIFAIHLPSMTGLSSATALKSSFWTYQSTQGKSMRMSAGC